MTAARMKATRTSDAVRRAAARIRGLARSASARTTRLGGLTKSGSSQRPRAAPSQTRRTRSRSPVRCQPTARRVTTGASCAREAGGPLGQERLEPLPRVVGPDQLGDRLGFDPEPLGERPPVALVHAALEEP